MDGLSGLGRVYIGYDASELGVTHLHVELLLRGAYRLVDDLVDGHADGAGVLERQRIVAGVQRHVLQDGLVPVVLGHLLKADVMCRAVDGGLHVAGLAAIAVADADVILAALGQLQLVAQGAVGAGLCLDEAQTGKVHVVLCPPAGVRHAVVHTLAVHVLSLDDDGASVGFGLLGLLECRGGQDVGLAVGGGS